MRPRLARAVVDARCFHRSALDLAPHNAELRTKLVVHLLRRRCRPRDDLALRVFSFICTRSGFAVISAEALIESIDAVLHRAECFLRSLRTLRTDRRRGA